MAGRSKTPQKKRQWLISIQMCQRAVTGGLRAHSQQTKSKWLISLFAPVLPSWDVSNCPLWKSISCFCSLEQKYHFLLFQHKWLRLIGVFILLADGNDGRNPSVWNRHSGEDLSSLPAACRVVVHLVIWSSPYVTSFDTSICSGWEYNKCGLSSTQLQNTAL